MIRLIAAIDRKQGIGKHGGQPWYIPDDENYFSAKTKSHGGDILVGSTTFKTFKGPLQGRQNFVLTHHDEPLAGATLVHDFATFLESYAGKDLWVVGGAKVFEAVMQAGQADELYLTHIDANFRCDQFFPDYKQGFKLAEQSDPHEQNGFRFSYARYVEAI